MLESKYRWRSRQLREHIEVLDGKRSPTKILYNATYLNGIFKQWLKANIWIYQDRIVYVGDKWPEFIDNQCERIDCDGFLLVPGYIEPHAHPFQIYNPLTFARYAAKYGTTVLINDNLMLLLNLSNKQAFSFLSEMNKIPSTMLWWSRFDSQTEILHEEKVFSNHVVKSWIAHPDVIQGGELTGWPKLLEGDDLILHWMQETKKLNKRIEGHFPGASEKTLAKLKLLGADADHEAMTGEEVKRRLLQGYMVSLRYSSIRPDLPKILDELHEMELRCYENFMLTTDGSPASFYERGVINQTVEIAINHGVPPIEAYLMATLNPAKYYQIDHLYGIIGTGRIANVNFIKNENDPHPVSVLAKGQWVKKDGTLLPEQFDINWKNFGFSPMEIDWNLSADDLQFSMPFGIQMENAVITKPYSITIDLSAEEIPKESDECFFMLLDRNGKWRINTLIKGFAKNLGGFASSFTNSGDIILIGKNKTDILSAFNRMKELGGGLVMVETGSAIYELPLPLGGLLSDLNIEKLIIKERELKELLFTRGYLYDDPIYTMLFFSSTHLPYIRITPRGLFDVMKKRVLFPTIMR